MYAAAVAKVVDADTLDLLVDLGFGVSTRVRARLADVYAPELATPEGQEAAAFTRSWVEENGPEFLVRTFRDRKERYGRYLAAVEPAGGGPRLDEALLVAGHATTQA
ncbi:hypothetical protein [Planomonospora algeriensis]